MVRYGLEYCCPVWSPTEVALVQALETVQRQFTRRISSCKDISYWERLAKLKILSLQRRRERYMIIHVWKIYNGYVPNDIDMKFRTNGRLGVKVDLIPFNHSAQRSVATAYDRSFGVRAGLLWNILPKHVNSQQELNAFKTALGSFIARYPDKPPISGYTSPNTNSLLDWSSMGDNQNNGRISTTC